MSNEENHSLKDRLIGINNELTGNCWVVICADGQPDYYATVESTVTRAVTAAAG